jgi:hypothetical protein
VLRDDLRQPLPCGRVYHAHGGNGDRFVADSALEGNGFEPSVPRCARTADSTALV